jgi:hypothetical protein
MHPDRKTDTIAAKSVRAVALAGLAAMLSGCVGMLPHTKTVTESPWQTFQEVQQVFDQIEPYKTTSVDLREMKLDPATNPNIAILNYSDVLRRFVPSPSINAKSIDLAVMECIEAKTVCRGYEIDQKSMKRVRNGGFWMDFLNFKRKIDIEGWRFTGVILVKGDQVIYKLTGGQPSIREYEESTTPMGPLQGRGESLLGRFF